MLFGSELFEDYIGQLAMASMASMDISAEEQFDAKKLQEKMRVRIGIPRVFDWISVISQYNSLQKWHCIELDLSVVCCAPRFNSRTDKIINSIKYSTILNLYLWGTSWHHITQVLIMIHGPFRKF